MPVPSRALRGTHTHAAAAAGTCANRLSARRCSAQPAALSHVSRSRRGSAQQAVRADGGEQAVCPVPGAQIHSAGEPPAGLPNVLLRPVSEAAVSSSKALEAFRASGGANRYASEPKSSIVAIGLSVHTAPVEIREKLAIAEAHWPEAIAQLCAYPHVEEAAVLSTCNRMEIYCVVLSYNRGVREVEEFLAKRSGVPLEELQKHLFLLRDRDATNHLLRVSAGLDSLIMGEGQILAQVKAVHACGEKAPGFGRHLNGLFKAAITAGKRVRTETGIASGAVSVSSAAAELAQMKLPTGNFDGCRVCIVGAGKMTRLLVKHLISKGCTTMTLVNRSMASAEALAAEFPEATIHIRLSPELLDAAAHADVIFTASSSEEPLLTAANVAPLPPASATVGGVRRLFDIAVPRNVSADCATLPGVSAYNVDDLREVVDANKEARLAAAEEAKALLEQERAAFEAWRDSLETVPTIKKLRAKAEAIRTGEVDKALKAFGPELSKKQRKVVEELSRGIINKLLHGPMQSLRSDGVDAASVSESLLVMHSLNKMWQLDQFVDEDSEAQMMKSL